MELDSPRELDNPLLQLFLDSCFLDVVFVTLFRTAVETAISEVDNFVVLAVADGLCGSESADELFILPPPPPPPPAHVLPRGSWCTTPLMALRPSTGFMVYYTTDRFMSFHRVHGVLH